MITVHTMFIFALSTTMILMMAFSIAIYSFTGHTSITAYSQPLSEFNFGAAGDFGVGERAENTTKNMANHGVEIITGLGDYRYKEGSEYVDEFWNDIVESNKGNSTWHGALGNHDVEDSHAYLNKFNQTGWIYSFDSSGVHFLVIDTNSEYKENSAQHNFVKSDLEKAKNNPNIKWKVVLMHHPMYSSCSHHCPIKEFANIYHPLFDQYNVDLVLQAHNHNYQRTFPLAYNLNNPTNPTITLKGDNYVNPKGQVYLVVGTGGRDFYSLNNTVTAYVANQFTGIPGYLDISILNNGDTLKGYFYANDYSIKDQFSITKSDNVITSTNASSFPLSTNDRWSFQK